MSSGTCAGACAPSTTVTIPSARARETISATGKTSPVSEVTWLTKTARVRSVRRARSRSATSCTGNGIGTRT